MNHRRNAIRPVDIENLLGTQQGSALNHKNHTIQRLSSERRLLSPRKRARSNKDYSIAINSKTRPSSEISQPSGVTPLTIPISSVQQAINYTNHHSIVPDWQSNPSVQERQVGKRKHAAVFYDEDYYESQPVFFDVIHPSELELHDGDMDEQKLATMHDDFMRVEVRVRSLLAHDFQVNEVQQRSIQASQAKGGFSSGSSSSGSSNSGSSNSGSQDNSGSQRGPNFVGDQCYSHDGISAADSPISVNETAPRLFKCSESTPFTSCCIGGEEICADDLLCHNLDGVIITRQYCTDPTWTTNQCSAMCPEFNEAGTVLTCCDAGRGYQVDPNNAAPLTSASTTTAPTAAPALPSPTNTPSSGLSGGAKAGIAIGAVAGVAIIAGLAFLLFRERKKRKALGQSEKQPPGFNNGYYGNAGAPNMQQQQQQPLQPQMPPQELGAYERNEHKYRFHSELGDGQGRPSELHS
ncbi:MAG: hypothetical protein Q9215_007061 [Flavoplaca cf. flavocitrina]